MNENFEKIARRTAEFCEDLNRVYGNQVDLTASNDGKTLRFLITVKESSWDRMQKQTEHTSESQIEAERIRN